MSNVLVLPPCPTKPVELKMDESPLIETPPELKDDPPPPPVPPTLKVEVLPPAKELAPLAGPPDCLGGEEAAGLGVTGAALPPPALAAFPIPMLEPVLYSP